MNQEGQQSTYRTQEIRRNRRCIVLAKGASAAAITGNFISAPGKSESCGRIDKAAHEFNYPADMAEGMEPFCTDSL